MADNKPSVVNVFDDGLTHVFRVTGSVGVSPNRPVCVSGNLEVQQILVLPNEFIGVALTSGTDDNEVSVQRRGLVKVFVTGAVQSGQPVIATGTSTAAAFKAAASVSAISGSTYFTAALGAFKIAGYACQAGADGDTLLIDLD